MGTLDEILLENNLKEQTVKSQQAQENLHTENKENIDKLNKFYIYLATLSGGAIVLSVSFLNNIGNIEYVKIRFIGSNFTLLYLIWSLLFLSIFCSLIRIYKHIEYAHLFRLSDLLTNKKKQRKLEKEFMQTAPHKFVNFENINFDEIDTVIENINKDIKKAENKSTIAYRWVNWCEIIARNCFITGILLLVVFAIISLENML